MRITTAAVMRNYNSSLSTSMNAMNTARGRVADGKRFHRAYEDPSAAMRASDLTRKYLKIDDYSATVDTCINRQNSADASIMEMVDSVGIQIKSDAMKAMTGTSSDEGSREALATSLRQLQDSLLQSANAKYEDSYVFAGADGGKIPFTKDDDGTVRYRGINVTTGEWKDHTNEEGLAELERLSTEKLYVDVGTGLQMNVQGQIANSTDDINGASAYDMALSGVKFLGYGSTNDTPPISKNIITLVGQMADALDPKLNPSFDNERFGKMFEQLKNTHGKMADFNAEVGIKENFLDATEKRLKTDKLNLYNQISSVENVEPAQAIMDYNYSQYCYNQLLKVGNSLLSNSFVDYMR